MLTQLPTLSQESISVEFDCISAKEGFFRRHNVPESEMHAHNQESCAVQLPLYFLPYAKCDNTVKKIIDCEGVEVERDLEGEKEIDNLYTSIMPEINAMDGWE